MSEKNKIEELEKRVEKLEEWRQRFLNRLAIASVVFFAVIFVVYMVIFFL